MAIGFETSADARPSGGITGRAAILRFLRNEDGTLTFFSVFMFILMLLIGGMAVDFMRFEARRVHVQNTLDAAILGAADLDQKLDAETVIKSYFEKAGLDPELVAVEATEQKVGDVELVGRVITAGTILSLDTFFLHMLNTPTLAAPVLSQARENIQNVEISLVLDISGSMRWNAAGNDPAGGYSLTTANRINDLKKAVKSFARQVLQVECTGPDGTGTCTQSPNTESTTINIIPYAGHVNPGAAMFEIMGGARWHNWSSCIEVTDADFADADLPDATSAQLPHFMNWPINDNWMNWGWCPKQDASILYASNSYAEIASFMDNVRMHDGTATHVGMKYGVALLNPSSRSAFQELNKAGIIADRYKNRPANWDDEVVKYLVLMTDGKTTAQFRPRVPEDGGPDDGPRRGWSYEDLYDGIATGLTDNPDVVLTSDFVADGIPDGMTVSAELGDILDRFGTVNRGLDLNDASAVEAGYPGVNTYNDGTVSHTEARNNANITRMCNHAKEPVYVAEGGAMKLLKDDRIRVFTISFLAPVSAQNLMRDCASLPASEHYFAISDLDIAKAFDAIAETINKLRLSL